MAATLNAVLKDPKVLKYGNCYVVGDGVFGDGSVMYDGKYGRKVIGFHGTQVQVKFADTVTPYYAEFDGESGLDNGFVAIMEVVGTVLLPTVPLSSGDHW